tara:strand:+ start:202 stop:654 length:453 start_codon:yes stop_codon:yes gene_type:complete
MINMKQMLGEAGRTMSNLDMLKNKNMRDILGESGKAISNMDRTIAAGMGQAMMSDNEPMMQDRSPANQMFSIDAQIENLMKSYNMLVNAQEFDRAQEVVNQIDQLQQQKISIQAQNVPSQAMMMGGTQYYDNLNQKPFANLQELLESISE